jgi:hypothetical protein
MPMYIEVCESLTDRFRHQLSLEWKVERQSWHRVQRPYEQHTSTAVKTIVATKMTPTLMPIFH